MALDLDNVMKQEIYKATYTPIAVPEVVSTGLTDLSTSIPSGWRSYVPASSWMNAGITIGLSGIGSLFGVLSSRSLYDMYDQNAKLAIENAQVQANRLQRRGNIAAANLMAQHAISEGKNELAVAGSGAGSVSGSFLDKLMANKKYDTREEFATDLNTIYAVSNARRQGYLEAYTYASQAYAKARETTGNIWSGFISGLVKATQSITKDIEAGKQLAFYEAQKASEIELTKWKILNYYGAPKLQDRSLGTFAEIQYGGAPVITNSITDATNITEWGFSNMDLYNLTGETDLDILNQGAK